jgi:hypothetical protein
VFALIFVCVFDSLVGLSPCGTWPFSSLMSKIHLSHIMSQFPIFYPENASSLFFSENFFLPVAEAKMNPTPSKRVKIDSFDDDVDSNDNRGGSDANQHLPAKATSTASVRNFTRPLYFIPEFELLGVKLVLNMSFSYNRIYKCVLERRNLVEFISL